MVQSTETKTYENVGMKLSLFQRFFQSALLVEEVPSFYELLRPCTASYLATRKTQGIKFGTDQGHELAFSFTY
jgi:hypothetical protein